MKNDGLILKVSCPDQFGLVAKISSYIASHEGNLVEFQQFADVQKQRFFARLEIDISGLKTDVDDFAAGFGTLGRSLGADWHFRQLPFKMRTAILTTRTDHCLNELLWRTRVGELPIEITSVIGNRNFCQKQTENAGHPFHLIDQTGDAAAKDTSFRKIAEIIDAEDVELIVLARYMQIVPDWFCERYAGRIINIHHSFLPAFIGANPYQRAYERGVKLIGATCHYVTADLDAGPIIEQEVHRVEHYHSPADLVRLGRDCERQALARGIRHHVHDRTIIDDNRAIVFAD